jgi:hypothetical protein
LCRAAAASGQQHHHQQQRAALLYDFHDQLIPYDKVSVDPMLLVLSFLISSNTMQKAAYMFVLHSPSPVVLGLLATWQQLSQ